MVRLTGALCLLALAGLASVQCQLAPNRYEEELLAQRRAITNWDAFKAGNDVDGWEDEWQQPSSTDVCSWTGVTCSESDSSVIALNLVCSYVGGPFCAVKAEGTLAPELGNIATLVELSLHGQRLAGTLPASWGQAGSFPGLKTLSLYGNNLTGGLPPGWGNQTAWPQLQKLDLKRNALSGELPSAWGAGFMMLQQLTLDENVGLGGALPPSWGDAGALPSLSTLSLGFCALNGSIPADWGALGAFPRLQELVLGNNQLAGTLPPDWGSGGALPSLLSLDLSKNELTGFLPDTWGNRDSFQTLKILALDVNQLGGLLPVAWTANYSFPNLLELNLDNNVDTELCGTLALKQDPVTVCKALATPASDADKLLRLQASISNWEQYSRGNNLTGWDAATPVCNWPGVECSENKAVLGVKLRCVSCDVRASGTLPAELAGISTLESLSLYGQNFTGTLPASWGSSTAFRNLAYLDLDGNDLSGSLPASWGMEVLTCRCRESVLCPEFLEVGPPCMVGAESSQPCKS